MKRKHNRYMKFRILVMLGAVLWLSSCATVKDIAYFQNKVVDHPEQIDKQAGIVIQPKDQISIVVSSRNPELVAMFNLPYVSSSISADGGTSGGGQRLLSYIVDNDGQIDFPVLGVLKVAGLTRWELAEMIKKELVNQKYLSDAVVTVQFMNFKVSAIGEVNKPGTFVIDGDRLTLLQAISMAGDLTIYGERNNVSVIRERNGERVIYEVSLCDVDLFKSPAYHLQQNDVIYVQPNRHKSRQSTVDSKVQWVTSLAMSGGSMLLSIASIIATVVVFR